MKVKELIVALQAVDGERLVVLQKDSEGNGYSPLAGIDDNCKYIGDTAYSGEVRIDKLTPEQIAEGFTDEDTAIDGEAALVLFPIN